MRITQTKLILCTSVFFVLFDNSAFFAQVTQIYPVTMKNVGFLASLAVGLTALMMLLLTLVSSKYTTKPVLMLFLMLSAFAAYFMNHYNVVIDDTMIQNILKTNMKETLDLLSAKLLYYALFLGILPSVLIYRIKPEPISLKKAILTKARDMLISLLVILAMLLLFSRFYTSFFREHKPLRYYANPSYYIYSMGKYLDKTFNTARTTISPVGEDAKKSATDTKRKLVILVVGEAVRADRLSLNGYKRQTTPLLQQENVISFSNMYSCGTTTAHSVPCMFSNLTRDGYSETSGDTTENLLDVLGRTNVHLIWRDNNSDSRDTAGNIPYQDYSKPGVNTICDGECRDEGMLKGLQEFIDGKPEGDILIVLHQMGNHGPAYYKRYPPEFEKFTPVCRTNQFDECTKDEIGNAYDNATLYTDYFLTKTIGLLKENSTGFDTALLYFSDHGESLGEYNIYLHGLPYAMAPDSQKHIAAFFWFGDGFKIDRESVRKKSAAPFSHDNLFHTVLGLMKVETSAYDKGLDILAK
jgi:lipid A ethanolaminephosphotransferase